MAPVTLNHPATRTREQLSIRLRKMTTREAKAGARGLDASGCENLGRGDRGAGGVAMSLANGASCEERPC